MTHAARTRSLESIWRIALGGFALLSVAMPVFFVGLESDLGWRGTLWWSALSLFVGAWTASQVLVGRRGAASVPPLWLLAIQGLSALVANWALPTVLPGVATGGVLLVLVAASLGGMRWSRAILWILLQSAGLLLIYLDAWASSIAWTAGSAYAAFQFAMVGVARLAAREHALRVELGGTVAELTSTRALLESSVRSAERARIARELHDLMGHHLVALGLQLDAASLEAAALERVAVEGSSGLRSRLGEARAVARLLLSDVRAAVSDLREEALIDLRGALDALASGGGGPRVEVRIADSFRIDDPARAAAFLRCAQESVTNARRHAKATTIRIEAEDDTLRVSDNGRGMVGGAEGSGLRGMRERVAALGGHVELGPSPEGGVQITVRIPEEARS